LLNVTEREGKLSKEEVDKLISEGYNVVYVEKENKTYIWKSASAKSSGVIK